MFLNPQNYNSQNPHPFAFVIIEKSQMSSVELI